jgi:hypothetical protein
MLKNNNPKNLLILNYFGNNRKLIFDAFLMLQKMQLNKNIKKNNKKIKKIVKTKKLVLKMNKNQIVAYFRIFYFFNKNCWLLRILPLIL